MIDPIAMEAIRTIGDVAKALIGTLVGAWLGYKFGVKRETENRLKDQKANGNFTMTVLARQYSDFLQTSIAIAVKRDEILQAAPGNPLWMQILPIYPSIHNPSIHPKTEDLVFLLEHNGKEGAAVIQAVLEADMKYHYFFDLLAAHAEQVKIVQIKLSESGLDPMGAPMSEIEKVVGLALTMSIQTMVVAIFEMMERDQKIFTEASDLTYALLVKIFGEKGIIKLDTVNLKKDPTKG